MRKILAALASGKRSALASLAAHPSLAGAAVPPVIGLLVTFGVHVSAGTTGLVEAAAAAAAAAVVSFRVKPWQPAAFIGAVTAIGTVLTAFRVPHVTPGLVAVVATGLAGVLGAILHGMVSPAQPKNPAPAG